MGVDLRAVKKQFADLVENIQPVAVSQFVVWLDEKVSEFKVNGQMRLDIELDAPAWIRKYSMSMLAAGLTPTTVDRTRPKITPKRPAPVFNSARKSTTTTMNNASTNRRFNRLPKIADVLNQSDTDDDVVVTTQATIQAGAVRDAVLGAPAATITSRPSVSLLNNRPVSSKPKTSRSSPLTLTAVTAKLKQDRPEEPSQKSLKLEEVDTESFNEASYVDKHDVADTGCSEVDRFRSATVKTEPQDSTGDQQPPNHALGAFVVGDAPCLSDPHDDDLDMSVEDGAAYLYPTAIRDLDASEYVAINTNSTENSRVGEEISTDLSNSGDYDGDGLESSYDDPADYMELINQSGSDKPHPGTSSESVARGYREKAVATSDPDVAYNQLNVIVRPLYRSAHKLPCLYCAFQTDDIKRYRKHLAAHIDRVAVPYTCVVCHKSAHQNIHHFVRHCMSHLGKIYKCPFCVSAFTRNEQYTMHVKATHGADTY